MTEPNIGLGILIIIGGLLLILLIYEFILKPIGDKQKSYYEVRK